MTTRLVNPFEKPGKWYKANFHTHTTTSDGVLSVDERVTQYRRAGYDVLAITDHYKTNDTRGLSDKKMLVISGMEYHPPCESTKIPYHILAINIPHGFEFDDSDDANRCIAQIKKAGGVSILAHPFWSSQEFADFGNLEGLAAMEVYNSTCDRHCRPSSENEWVYCLDRGYVLPGIANDDAHLEEEDVFGGWTWLKMPSLSVANVLKAIRTGACYATCGPKIHNFRVMDGRAYLRCSPVKKIQLIGCPIRGARRMAEEGKSITAFSVEVPDWQYVRAVVTDASGKQAWTNPINLNR